MNSNELRIGQILHRDIDKRKDALIIVKAKDEKYLELCLIFTGDKHIKFAKRYDLLRSDWDDENSTRYHEYVEASDDFLKRSLRNIFKIGVENYNFEGV